MCMLVYVCMCILLGKFRITQLTMLNYVKYYVYYSIKLYLRTRYSCI